MTRSGSQNRKQTFKRAANCTAEEAALFDALQAHYPSCSDMIKARVLNPDLPLPRAPRLPASTKTELARLVGTLGQLSDSIEHLKCEGHDATILDAIAGDMADIRVAAFQALGRKP